MNDTMITRQDAANQLGVSLRTVARYLEEGRLVRYARLGRVYVDSVQVAALASYSPKK